jgi:rhodanese-related sulfurtransferase
MEIPRTTVDELKAMMDRGEPVIILDVRRQEAYASSDKMIKSAVRLDPENDTAIKEFAKELDKNSTIVVY